MDSRTGLPVTTVRALISQLLGQANLEVQALSIPAFRQTHVFELFNRQDAEDGFAAMSLACHIFQFEKGRWPQSLEELIPDSLPHAVIDPWGDGKQTLGYVLIKGGLPDGSDRPLVFSRCDSKDGMFFVRDRPDYDWSWYEEHDAHFNQVIKQDGQFRDVARWRPPNRFGPATLPVP